MALQLMKLLVTASTTTTVGVEPKKFFYVTTAETIAGATLTINATQFFNDAGAAVTELPELAANNSYFNVYINGVLQMKNITTYTSGATGVGSLAIHNPAGAHPIRKDTPIVLEVANYSPTSTTDIAT